MIKVLIVISILCLYSCGTKGKRQSSISKSCGTDCEVAEYELLLSQLGIAEHELTNGNAFQALKGLNSIKGKAYYHGKFKSLFKLSLEACIVNTNSLAKEKSACEVVSKRSHFIQKEAPDYIPRISEAINLCNIDLRNSTDNKLYTTTIKDFDLTSSEAASYNLPEAVALIKNKYNTLPWEKLLNIDLDILSEYKFELGVPELENEMPSATHVRYTIPLKITFNGDKDSHCRKYKKALHTTKSSIKRNCFDYPTLSELFSSKPPTKWTDDTYLTEINLTNQVDKALSDIPFTASFPRPMVLGLIYKGKSKSEFPLSVSYPGNNIPSNFIGRLSFTQQFTNKIAQPGKDVILLVGRSEQIIKMQIRQSRFFGFELIADIPANLVENLEGFTLRIPVEEIRDHFHESMMKE